MSTVKLVLTDGELELPSGEILLYVYDAGDCDAIYWPAKYNEEHLISALFDARELGDVPEHCNTAVLPNGNEVRF